MVKNEKLEVKNAIKYSCNCFMLIISFSIAIEFKTEMNAFAIIGKLCKIWHIEKESKSRSIIKSLKVIIIMLFDTYKPNIDKIACYNLEY